MLRALSVLMIFMVFLGHCRDFYYINEYQTTAYYQCYKQQGYNQTGGYIEPHYPSSIDESIQNMKNAKNAGLELSVALIICRTLTPEQQVEAIVKNMGLSAIKQFWIYPDPGCSSWTSSSPEANCLYLQKTIEVVKNTFGVSVGVLAGNDDWRYLFKSQTYCPDVSDSPLWWFPTQSQQNSQPNFANYQQIGGWKVPTMKIYSYSK